MTDKSGLDYAAVGLRCGLEIHQQLDTHKLFCNCPSELNELTGTRFVRTLRPTQGELGETDAAALAQAARKLHFTYQVPPTVCLVEMDEEPPHCANPAAVDTALLLAKMLGARILDEIHFMRKIVIDGSNTSGFQRTALVAIGGRLEYGSGSVSVSTICLEEDAARTVGSNGDEITYRLDRLGIPLVEIATGPDLVTPAEVQAAAARIGALLRTTGRVKRGIGTIREDVNISVTGGARVEIKGVQELRLIPKYVEEEVRRQLGLIECIRELERRNFRAGEIDGKIFDITAVFQNTAARVISGQMKSGGRVLAIRLPKFAGLFRDRLGPELAGYAKTRGVRGLFHTDELPGYGITEVEVGKINEALGLGPGDGYVLVAEKEDIARSALDIIVHRARLAHIGVPKETRDPQPDGKSVYSRPLPGAARMYPETDVPPVRADAGHLEQLDNLIPELPEARHARFKKQYGLNDQQARAMLSSGYEEDFETLAREFAQYSGILTRIILNTLPELETGKLDISGVGQDILRGLLVALSGGRFAKEGVPAVLREMVVRGTDAASAASALGLGEASDAFLDEVVDRVVNSNEAVVLEKGERAAGPLMGAVMKELRGKLDGRRVSEALERKIRAVIASHEGEK